MKQPIASSISGAILLLITSCTFANPVDEKEPGENSSGAIHQQTPYVTMNIGVEISGLEQAAEDAAEGINLIGQSLHELATNNELTPDQNERIQQALTRVDELGQSIKLTVEQLPNTVEKSALPIVKAGNELSSQIKWIVIVTSVALIFIILAVLGATYYFVLAPSAKAVVGTADQLRDLADSLKITAKIVEKSSAQNLQVMEEIHKMNRKSVSGKSERGEVTERS